MRKTNPGSARRRRTAVVSTTLALAAFALALGGPPAVAAPASHCDPLDPSSCMLPFPNDYFTARDPGTTSGRRVNFLAADMPRNLSGTPIDPAAYNRNDGFSPGQPIVTHVPGLDNPEAFRRTGAVPVNDIAQTYARRQAVVVIDARTLRRQLIWAELDSNATSPATTDLLIHPGVNFAEGHRYIVALRNLRDANGNVIEAQQAFRNYRDGIATNDPAFEARRPHMETILRRIASAGIRRHSLYLAWDFTVASAKNLAERALSIRNDAFNQLGDRNLADRRVAGRAPTYNVTKVQDFAACAPSGCAEGQSDTLARQVSGTFQVPCYLNRAGCPSGAQMTFAGPSNVPQRIPGNTDTANFLCDIPRSAVDGGVHAARPSLYGHGLLGGADEINAGNVKAMANEHNFVFCATNWIGLAEEDTPNAVNALTDLSTFPSIPDRLQQSYVNFMYLGRLMIHRSGFAADPAFQAGGRSLIDTRHLFYDGNSQGGIEGGALTALAPDFTHAVLGVPGMNYSLLVDRSVDFAQFGNILNAVYPNRLERPLILSLLQMLWDRGDADGYAAHMTTRHYPDTPSHTVLLEMAFGDHQVTNWATEVEARTIGARIRQPELDPGRSPEVTPYFGIRPITHFPFRGSALVVWDTGPARTVNGVLRGTGPPPLANLPNSVGDDPHEAPRADPFNRQQKSGFLQAGGAVFDVCGAHPCYADGWTGP